MKSGEYWKARFNDIEQRAHDQGATCFQDIEGRYSKAIRQLTEQILSWYQRFADNNEISLADARKWLNGKDLEEFRWTVQEYIRYGQENAVDGQWTKQLENASSRYHVSRLEALRTQLQQQVEVLHGGTLESLTKTLKSVYSDSYYRAAFEVQKGVGVGWSFDKLDQRLIDKVINNPWSQSGDRFSDVIWKDKKKLLSGLETDLTQGLILGKDPQKVIDSMSKKLNTSKSVTGRLVMTESAFFSQQAQHDAFGALGVEKYEIVATLDGRTSELCRWMDGKVFKRSEWEVGVTAPPFHPWCRTTTVPHFDDEFDIGERAARDEDGNVYYVPENMTYKDWKKRFVDSPVAVGQTQMITEKASLNTYSVDRRFVNSKKFHDSFDNLTQRKAVNESIYQESMKILEHRDGTILEDMVVLDAKTGKVIAKNTESKESGKTGLTQEQYRRYQKEKGEKILLHNHPNSGRLSFTDLRTLFNNDDIEASIAVGHNGHICIASCPDRNVDIEKLYESTYNKYKHELLDSGLARIHALDDLYDLGIFKYESR